MASIVDMYTVSDVFSISTTYSHYILQCSITIKAFQLQNGINHMRFAVLTLINCPSEKLEGKTQSSWRTLPSLVHIIENS